MLYLYKDLTHALSTNIISLFSYTYFCHSRAFPAQGQVFQLLFVFFEQSLLQTKTVGWAISTKANLSPTAAPNVSWRKWSSFHWQGPGIFVFWQGIKRLLCCESSATCKRNVSEICEGSQIFTSHSHLNKTSNEGEVISWGVKNIQSKSVSGYCLGKVKPDKQPFTICCKS